MTDFIKNKYYKENKLVINNNYCLNDIKGDPCPCQIKHLILKYNINNNIIEEVYHEHNKNININFDGPYLFTFGYVNLFKNDMFNNILSNISYNNDFILKSNTIKNQINADKKINIIHLRLEDDGILHWSNQNNITPTEYKEYLEEKYIHLIKTYISNVDETILLSSSLSNKVINFLNVNNYNYKFIDKCFKDREKNAIIDLLLSSCCNNIFIGNFNINSNNGSVFSYYISKYIKNKITTICIDLDRIYNKEIVIY